PSQSSSMPLQLSVAVGLTATVVSSQSFPTTAPHPTAIVPAHGATSHAQSPSSSYAIVPSSKAPSQSSSTPSGVSTAPGCTSIAVNVRTCVPPERLATHSATPVMSAKTSQKGPSTSDATVTSIWSAVSCSSDTSARKSQGCPSLPNWPGTGLAMAIVGLSGRS